MNRKPLAATRSTTPKSRMKKGSGITRTEVGVPMLKWALAVAEISGSHHSRGTVRNRIFIGFIGCLASFWF
jgi:hypothetical protein